MGYGTFDSGAYRSYSTAHLDGRSTEQIFNSSKIDPLFDPLLIFDKRESRDSVANPNSTPIIIAADVTGSMGFIIDNLIRDSIPKTFEEILRRAALPTMTMVTDPHLMVMGIGDAACDKSPLQVTQFESDIKIIEQVKNLWLEKGGGGNYTESYDLAWYYAATHTSIDSFEKHGRKGYLFTIGDEESPHGLTTSQIMKFIGDESESLSPEELLAMAQEMYHVRHIIAEEGSHCRNPKNLSSVRDSWFKLMGQTVIHMPDHTKLAELIVSAIQVNEGMPVDEVVATWDSSTADSIKASLSLSAF